MLLVFTTCKPEEAEGIVKKLLEKKLVACGNIIGPVTSLYRWKGDNCRDQEAIIFMETTEALKEELSDELQKLHSYEVPKLVFLKTADINKSYLEWMSGELKS